MTAPEFSRPLRLDRIGTADSDHAVTANADERAALAQRFDLIAIDRLAADYSLRRDGDGVFATGTLLAAVTQRCVATGQPVPATVDEPFTLRFLPDTPTGEDEVELDEDDCDTMFFDGGAIDLGEAAAETLALALDPWPRAPDADATLKAAGVLQEDEAGPFAALKALKDKLG